MPGVEESSATDSQCRKQDDINYFNITPNMMQCLFSISGLRILGAKNVVTDENNKTTNY